MKGKALVISQILDAISVLFLALRCHPRDLLQEHTISECVHMGRVAGPFFGSWKIPVVLEGENISGVWEQIGGAGMGEISTGGVGMGGPCPSKVRSLAVDSTAFLMAFAGALPMAVAGRIRKPATMTTPHRRATTVFRMLILTIWNVRIRPCLGMRETFDCKDLIGGVAVRKL